MVMSNFVMICCYSIHGQSGHPLYYEIHGNVSSTGMYCKLTYIKYWDFFCNRIIPQHIML
ncbi:hypothetical protein HZS_6158 [Henneguya salminicola]|nr:hypothetical protein HZS_6158 [Henneguya salminicola]